MDTHIESEEAQVLSSKEIPEADALLAEERDVLARAKLIAARRKVLVVESIKKYMTEHGVSVEDLGGAAKKTKKVEVKYRDSAGNEWTGRGRQPKWMHGDKSLYLINKGGSNE